jgi:hypothetical protein
MKLKLGIHKKRATLIASALGLALAIPAISHAQVTLNANDALGASSFNSAGGWSDAAAPSAGKTYSTQGYLLRSPTTAGSYIFAGDSLTVGGGSGGGAFSSSTANNNALIFKVSGISLTVNNLILDGSQIRDGNGDGQYAILNGNISVTANGGSFIAQDTNIINSAISGIGPIYIGNNGSGSAARVIVFTSGLSTYAGNILMDSGGNGANNSRLTFTAVSIMNYIIGDSGVNNNISGAGTVIFGGDFNFDLSGAGTTVGDSWNIVDSSVVATYDPTFSVNGFTQNGALWSGSANGIDYQFDTTDGRLSVAPAPEPSTLALCGMGLAGLFAVTRRKK